MLVPDWGLIGTGLLGLVMSVGTYYRGRSQRVVETAKDAAEVDVIGLLRTEVLRLSARVTALEGREGRLIRHVYKLEGLMAGAGMAVPNFEIDGGANTPVGQVAAQ